MCGVTEGQGGDRETSLGARRYQPKHSRLQWPIPPVVGSKRGARCGSTAPTGMRKPRRRYLPQ